MKDLTRKNDAALSAREPGNIDGKGLNGFMLDWYQTEPRDVVAKPQPQVLAEFFTSMLVLSAEFKYKPSTGVQNYLYYVDDSWLLSLIAPEEWSASRRAAYVGTCVLHDDMSWTINPTSELAERPRIADAIGRFYDAFAEKMDTELTLEEILPFHVRQMPYWQRLHASALSRSIRSSVGMSGHTSIRARDWRLALPAAGADCLRLIAAPAD